MIHVYTGNGKGKTTAAIGLAVRAAGAGFKVAMIQFLKGQGSNEIKALKTIKNIKIFRFGSKKFIYKQADKIDKEEAIRAYKKAKQVISTNNFGLVILDEINLTGFFNILDTSQIIDLIKSTPPNLELVLTGRKIPKNIYQLADYVTEMKEIKHPYQKGILARKGIEY